MPGLPTLSCPTLSSPPVAGTELEGDALAQARQLRGALESWARWAAEPIASAELLLEELVEWAARAQVDPMGLQVLIAFVLGKGDHRTHDDRRLQARADVQRMLARVRRTASALREVEARSQHAGRQVLALAMRAPVLATEAAQLVARSGHAVPIGLAQLPARIKRKADKLRAEIVTLGAQADRMIERVASPLQPRPQPTDARRVPRTDRLRAVDIRRRDAV